MCGADFFTVLVIESFNFCGTRSVTRPVVPVPVVVFILLRVPSVVVVPLVEYRVPMLLPTPTGPKIPALLPASPLSAIPRVP
ncbi:hypothetical protein D3C81_1240550 [compost metagenome]